MADIAIGGDMEGKAADGEWWPITIRSKNEDGTYNKDQNKIRLKLESLGYLITLKRL